MLEQCGLDFRAVHVLAAANDHVLLAIHDVHAAVVVDPPDVAGVEPAVRKGLVRRLRVVPIAFDHVGSAHPELAQRVARKLVAVIVDRR